MPNRSSKSDFAQNALRVVEISTGQKLSEEQKRNPAAVSLGRLGGLKGGRVRAERLSKAERSAIAKKAAAARWKKPD